MKSTDRQLAVDEVSADPMVDAFVAAADQAEPGPACQLGGDGLVEPPAARPEQEQWPRRVDGLDAGEDGLGTQDHSRSSAERGVVHGPVHIGGVVAKVVTAKVQQPSVAGPPEQALPAEPVDQTREDGEHVDAHAGAPSVEQTGWRVDRDPSLIVGDEE